MNDFNRGALQIPCLRLDYGFGEQWASVELGDGTGYVRLTDYEELASKNAKLRELVRDMWNGMCARAECRHCEHYELNDGQRFVGECEFHKRMREFGIEVD